MKKEKPLDVIDAILIILALIGMLMVIGGFISAILVSGLFPVKIAIYGFIVFLIFGGLLKFTSEDLNN